MLKSRYILCKPGLPFTPILKKWIAVNKALVKEWDGQRDVPWWYNERADLSVLAGAIWRARGSAFEEYVDAKFEKSRRSKRKRRFLGRVDLFFTYNGTMFIAEAKQCWSGASVINGNPLGRIQKRLQSACDDIKKTKAKGQKRLAIVFVKPMVRKKHKKEVDRLLQEWTSRIETIDCDAMAWVFPKTARQTKWREYLFPGVVVMMKRV
jgi:hypothetical protein